MSLVVAGLYVAHSLLESVELEPSTSVYIDESQTRKRIYFFVSLIVYEDLRSLTIFFGFFVFFVLLTHFWKEREGVL